MRRRLEPRPNEKCVLQFMFVHLMGQPIQVQTQLQRFFYSYINVCQHVYQFETVLLSVTIIPVLSLVLVRIPGDIKNSTPINNWVFDHVADFTWDAAFGRTE